LALLSPKKGERQPCFFRRVTAGILPAQVTGLLLWLS
jgi:hypothetical protein